MEVEKIPDKEVEKIPVKDCKEKLVKINSKKIKKTDEDIIINNTHPAAIVKEETQYLRKTLAKKLHKAQKDLKKINPNYRIMVSQAFRSLDTQKRCYNYYYNKFREQNPNLSERKIKEKTDNFVASPEETPPHTTGAAVDLTIIYENKKSNKKNPEKYKQIDMGTELQSMKEESATNSKNITKEQEKNRKLLIKIMEKQSFVNYPIEWWHWSYKDKYWVAKKNRKGKKKKYAIYGTIKKLNQI